MKSFYVLICKYIRKVGHVYRSHQAINDPSSGKHYKLSFAVSLQKTQFDAIAGGDVIAKIDKMAKMGFDGVEPAVRDPALVELSELDIPLKQSGLVVQTIGNGKGYSVLEVIETVRKVTGVNIPVKVSARKTGDPAILIASTDCARDELQWEPQFPEIEVMTRDAWKWMKKHPYGYHE